MPALPTTPTPTGIGTFTISFIDAGGEETTTSINDFDPSVTSLQLSAVQVALGNLSNAAVYAQQTTAKIGTSRANVTPFDESFSEGSTKMVLVFENDSLDIRQVTVPAPDIQFFETDRITAKISDPAVVSAVNAILNVLNAGSPAGTFKYVRGYRSDRMRKLPKARFTPTIAEPGGADAPSDLPALPEP